MSTGSTVAAVLMVFNTSGDAPPKPQPLPVPTDRSVLLSRVPRITRPGPRSLKDRRNAGEHPPLPWENM